MNKEDKWCGDISISQGMVKVTMEYIGEGYNGDYNPEDPKDEPLVRFSVDCEGMELCDASYCTEIPVSTSEEKVIGYARQILHEVKGPLESGHSIKRLCERLSWLYSGVPQQ
jgi:hypothetical protein